MTFSRYEVEYYHPHIGHRVSPLSFHNGQRTWRYGYPPMLYPTHSTGLLVGVTTERLTEVSSLVDLYESLAMTVPGIVAHQSALKGGEQLRIPSFERP